MKRNTSIIALLALAFVVSGPVFQMPLFAESETGDITNRSAQAVNFTAGIDTDRYRTVSAQAIYSDGTPASHSVLDGKRSVNRLTVLSTSNLTTSYATIQINVNHNTIPAGTVIVLENQRLVEGKDWFIGGASSATAYSIAGAVNAFELFNSTHAGTVTLAIATATVVGTAPNSWAASCTSSSITFSGATFSGGNNAATISINGVTLTNGAQWTIGASTTTTAADISRAIVAHASLTGVVVSTVTGNFAGQGGIIFTTATYVGLNAYQVSASTPGLLWTSSYYTGGLASEINTTTYVLTEASHGLTTGLKVYVSTNVAASTMPTGLTGGATYYAIKVNDSSYQLATSSTNATAGTPVSITALTGNSSLGVYPLALASGAGTGIGSFKWQVSNDNSNWTDLSVSSVTWSGTAGNTAWDFGEIAYRFLRLNFIGPINGGIRLLTYVNGKVAQ